jgi:segregation and condensation protein A
MGGASDLELDLDVFQGPFDLLLALVLREEVELADVPVADIVVAYVERLAAEGEIDLAAATEFVVLVAALLELKARLLFPDEEDAGEELTPEQAESELLARLVEYRRYQGAAGWLGRRGAEARVFRAGPPPLAPRPQPVVVPGGESPVRLVAAMRRLLEPPPAIDTAHVRRRLVPIDVFLDRFRRALAERRGFTFEEAVRGLDRLAQATAFLAVLELVKRGEAEAEQPEAFAPIRVRRRAARPADERAIA